MQIEKSLLYQRILIIAFWIRGTYGFFFDELVPFLASAEPFVNLAFDAVLISMGLIMIRKRIDIIMLVSFLLFSWISTCIFNDLSFIFYINGLRDFIIYLFIIPIIRYFFETPHRKEQFVADFDRTLFLFLVVQVPCIAFQFLKYGANDHGGGSLGNWNSGIISAMIYMISFYLIKKRFDNKQYFMSLWTNKVYILLLIPTFFNETKISFIFLIMYFLLLVPIDYKAFIRVLILIPMSVMVIWCISMFYLSVTGGGDDVFTIEYYTEMYLMSDESEEYAKWLLDEDVGGLEDIPRITKIILLGDFQEEAPLNFMFGFGVGQFKGGTFIEFSDFFKNYEWLLIGSIPYVFHLIVQLGIVGAVWFFLYWIIYFRSSVIGAKRDLGMQLYLIFTFILILLYNDSLRNSFMGLVIMYFFMSSWIVLPEKEEKNDSLC